ncbi:MAG: hypothetical protein IJA55_04285 [Clostridia bacterium]|nr:hypothetical protein [Clostridia bacterium]
MKKKRMALAVVGIIVILLAINFFVNGFEFFIYGVCSFNSKYYDSPKIAFEQNEEIDISEDIGIAEIDSHNVMYFAKISDGDILVAQMKCKDNKYFFIGDYSLASDYSFEPNMTDNYSFQQNCMYKENGLFKCYFEYFVVTEQPDSDIDGCTIVKFDVDMNKNLYFVYRIVQQ